MPCGQFPANRLNEPKSQSDIASRPLPKAPPSSSQYDVVPQMIIRSSNVRPREFAIGDAKRLLQQYLPVSDSSTATESRYSITRSACARRVGGRSSPIAFAVFRLTISSNRLGRWIGRSPGLAPRKILSTEATAFCISSRYMGP